MATRSLIAVINKKGEVKVANYNQFDGYIEHIGVSVLKFISNQKKMEKLEENIENFTFTEDIVREENAYYMNFLSSYLGVQLLENIANMKKEKDRTLYNYFDFMKDSLFCEYAYVINFQKKQLEIFTGLVIEPHNSNPYFSGDVSYVQVASDGTIYFPVKLVKTFQLSDLPTVEDFKKMFE